LVGWLNCRGEDGGVRRRPMKGPSQHRRCAGGGGGGRGGGNEAPRRIPDEGPPGVEHWSAHDKNMEGLIRRAIEMTAATATARGGDDGGDDDNDDNFTIAMVINLDLHTAGV